MNLTITEKTNNPLLSRTEVQANIIFEGSTPKRVQVQKALAKSLKADEKMVIVQTIHTSFGEPKAHIVAHAYSDEKAMKDNERANLLEKHTGHGKEPEKPAEEAKEAPAAPSEEAPKEAEAEKKEEAASEEKPAEETKKEEVKEEKA